MDASGAWPARLLPSDIIDIATRCELLLLFCLPRAVRYVMTGAKILKLPAHAQFVVSKYSSIIKYATSTLSTNYGEWPVLLRVPNVPEHTHEPSFVDCSRRFI